MAGSAPVSPTTCAAITSRGSRRASTAPAGGREEPRRRRHGRLRELSAAIDCALRSSGRSSGPQATAWRSASGSGSRRATCWSRTATASVARGGGRAAVRVAAGGQILATEIVGRMARAARRRGSRALGEMELKGLPEPVPVIEIGWSRLAAQRPPPHRSLLERDGELARLVQAFEDAATATAGSWSSRGHGRNRQDDAARRGATRTPSWRCAPAARSWSRTTRGVGAAAVRALALDRSSEGRARAAALGAADRPRRARRGRLPGQQPFAAVHGLYWLAINVRRAQRRWY